MLATQQLSLDEFETFLRTGSACKLQSLDSRDQTSRSLELAKKAGIVASHVKSEKGVSLTDLANLCQEIQSNLEGPGEVGGTRSFDHVRMWHIGSPQDVGVASLPFIYHTLSLYIRPDLPIFEDSVLIDRGFPKDLIDRARLYQKYAKYPGGYTHPQGCLGFREEIAEWFTARDGYECDPNTIFMTNGASEALPTLLQVLIQSGDDAILLPCPTFFLWEQSVRTHGGHVQFYELSEQGGFGLDIEQLIEAYAQARSKGLTVRGMVLINPGNPVPMLLTKEVIARIVAFCEERDILLIADEVYQTTAYRGPFVSCRQVVRSLGADVVVASLHSASKGIYGEGGHRAGLLQLENADAGMIRQMQNIRNLAINPNNVGQVVMTLSLKPPQKGDQSYEEFAKLSEQRLKEYRDKAIMIQEFFNSLEDAECQELQGGMYAFPLIRLPPKYVAYAEALGVTADHLYVEQLLRATGICVIPGSSLGRTVNQRGDSYHLRVCILASVDDMKEGFCLWRKFHQDLFNEYK